MPEQAVVLRPTFGPAHGGTTITTHLNLAARSLRVFAGNVPLNCSSSSSSSSSHGNATHCCCMPPQNKSVTAHHNAMPLSVRSIANHKHALHHAMFTYYAVEPTYRWVRPANGPARGGVAITISARNWPSAATAHGARCRFGHHHHLTTVPASPTAFLYSSRSAGRARRVAGETLLRCVVPAGAGANSTPHDVALLIAPNGVDFQPTNLTFRYDAAIGATTSTFMSLIATCGLCMGVAALIHATHKLRRELASSGWATSTPSHWSYMKYAAHTQRRREKLLRRMGMRDGGFNVGFGVGGDEAPSGGDGGAPARASAGAAPRVVVRAPAELLQPLGSISEELSQSEASSPICDRLEQ